MITAIPVFILALTTFNLHVETGTDSVLLLVMKDKVLDGWTMQEDSKHYLADEWIKDYPGMAQLFSEYGLNEFLRINFREPGDQVIVAEIYHMKDHGGAYGLFSVSRDSGGILADYGDESYKDEHNIYFWKGNYYVRVFSKMETFRVKEGISTIAGSIDEKIEAEGERPAIVEKLPEEGFVTERTRYFRGVAGLHFNLPFGHEDFSGFSEGVYGDFGTHRLLLLEYESESSMKKWIEKIGKNLDNNKRYSKVNENCEYHCFTDLEGNRIVFGSAYQYIMVFMGKELTRQPEIFERIEDAMQRGFPENKLELNEM